MHWTLRRKTDFGIGIVLSRKFERESRWKFFIINSDIASNVVTKSGPFDVWFMLKALKENMSATYFSRKMTIKLIEKYSFMMILYANPEQNYFNKNKAKKKNYIKVSKHFSEMKEFKILWHHGYFFPFSSGWVWEL